MSVGIVHFHDMVSCIQEFFLNFFLSTIKSPRHGSSLANMPLTTQFFLRPEDCPLKAHHFVNKISTLNSNIRRSDPSKIMRCMTRYNLPE